MIMKFLNHLFKRYCKCLTCKKSREGTKVEPVPVEPNTPKQKPAVDNSERARCIKCSKVIRGLRLSGKGTSVEVTCARCKDAQ